MVEVILPLQDPLSERQALLGKSVFEPDSIGCAHRLVQGRFHLLTRVTHQSAVEGIHMRLGRDELLSGLVAS